MTLLLGGVWRAGDADVQPPPSASTGPSLASSAQQSPALLLDGDFTVISR